MAGFYESAEGWNGEYPFGDKAGDEGLSKKILELEEAFEKEWKDENGQAEDSSLCPWGLFG
jgi:hypothetical protein